MKKTVSLTIDNRQIYADEGTTILEAARQNNIHIPTMCYHPRLEPMGHCRLCLVEIEGMSRPVTSCDNPVADRMVVRTDTPRLRDMRSKIIELALTTHPYKDCLTCVRTGTCELQEKAYEYQVNLPEQFDRDIPIGEKADNPDIVRDEEKCILCGRCIQVCRSGPGKFVYSMIGKGVNTRVAPVKDGKVVSLEEAGCIFCGQCVDVCPVAALSEVGRKAGGREWELFKAAGVCIECSIGCYLERYSSNGEIVKVTVPAEGDPVSWICSRGRFGFREESEKAHSAAVRKEGPKKVVVEIAEAYREAGAAIRKIKEEWGPQSLALLAAGDISNEESYLLQKLGRTVLGTGNIDLGAEKTWAEAYYGAMSISGPDICGPAIAELAAAPVITVIGDKLAESHPVAAMAVEKAARYGDALIIRVQNSEELHAWHELNLDGKGSSLAGLFEKLNVTLESNLNDDFRKDKILEAAKAMTDKQAVTLVTPAFFAASDSDTVKLLIRLLEKSGQLSRGRNRSLMLSAFSNALGVLLTGGTPYHGPGFTALSDPQGMNRLEIEEAAVAGRVKGLILFGRHNQSLPLKHDLYCVKIGGSIAECPSEQGVFIAAEAGYLKEGHFTNAGGLTRANRRIENLKEPAIEGWRIITNLAQALGARWSYKTLEDVRLEMKSITPAG